MNCCRLCTALLLLCAPLLPQTQEQIAREFVKLLAKQDFAKAETYFDESTKGLVSAGRIEAVWKALVDKAGPLSKQLGVRTARMASIDFVYVDCQFETQKLSVKVALNDKHKIVGFSFVPLYVSVEAKRPDSVIEQRLDVSDLPGTLTNPKEGSPFPAVVLVHGSGPHDQDETLGPNKPFRDLAWGLAAQGVAVLRYDKRTKVHPEQFHGDFTVKQEAVDDALAAVNLLRKMPDIDPKRIYVLGHSLGGMLIPRIGKADPNLAGLIVMAGTTRPLEDVIVEQTEYLGLPNLQKTKAQAQAVKELKTGDRPVLGIPASYWLDLRGYDPAEAAKQLKQPILILQGERDYQVTMQDFAGWKAALSSRPNVTLKSYPALNHLFLPGEGKSRPTEYDKPGRVAEAVIDDIAAWIKLH